MNKPYIMSPQELTDIPDGTVVWREKHHYNNSDESVHGCRLMPMVMFNGMIANYYDYLYPDELAAADDIQLRFRYWNEKPTEEVMDNELWVLREEWKE